MATTTALTNLQQELLKVYASDIDEKDLLEIRRMLAKYFADKAVKEADAIWDEKGYSQETMEQWLNEDGSGYKKQPE